MSLPSCVGLLLTGWQEAGVGPADGVVSSVQSAEESVGCHHLTALFCTRDQLALIRETVLTRQCRPPRPPPEGSGWASLSKTTTHPAEVGIFLAARVGRVEELALPAAAPGWRCGKAKDWSWTDVSSVFTSRRIPVGGPSRLPKVVVLYEGTDVCPHHKETEIHRAKYQLQLPTRSSHPCCSANREKC